ncbi:hypothetical protein [Bradyrhizobium sp. LMTR 3]|uniref:hypothetical protein n=1 Tax=Bradyrhizobium sp. LMTR 3 TaxID=189873 RepID=UPI0011474C23|nr:hypothetical protein [Bradyrhizobium sp. LMTR 3]
MYNALPKWDARVHLSQFQRGCEMRLPQELRERHYYSVDIAGAQIGWSRAGSYRAAERGDIPVERDGRFLLVPKRKWDRIVKRITREERTLKFDPGSETKKSPGGVSGA